MKTIDMSAERNEMVHDQIEARGVRDPLVLDAMRTVPREEFLPKRLREFAYEDAPLPIAEEQTISQPYIVAFMIEALALKGGERVLEIGTGSGYAAAVLGEIAKEVYTIERIELLADQTSVMLKDMNCLNVHVLHSDGTRGWPEQAPFDAIVVAAGGPTIPEALKSQLKVGGRLVIPVGTTRTNQELMRVTRVSESKFTTEDIADVRFVPLIGDEGWKESADLKEVPSSKKLPVRITKEDPELSKLIAKQCERLITSRRLIWNHCCSASATRE